MKIENQNTDPTSRQSLDQKTTGMESQEKKEPPASKIPFDRVKSNDPRLTHLVLRSQNLTVSDLKELAEVIRHNTIITLLDISDNLLGDLETGVLPKNRSLTTVMLGGNRITAVGAKILSENKTLTSLDLSHNHVGPEGATALAQQVSLTHLNLADNDIHSEGAMAFAQNQTLTSLNLSNNHIDFTAAPVLASNKKLIFLQISGNRLGDIGAMALAGNNTLTSLDISYNEITVAAASAFARNTTLTHLNINYNRLGVGGARLLACHPALISLAVAGNQINNEGIVALAQNKVLTQLDLSYNQINDEGLEAIKELAQSLNFVNLDLSYNQIGPVGAITIALNPKLTRLLFAHNLAGDVGAAAFAKNNMLRYLDLTANHIGFEGAYALSHNTTLQTLILSSNAVGDAGALVLARSTTLEELFLSNNQIGYPGAMILAENARLKVIGLNDNPVEEKGAEPLTGSKQFHGLPLSSSLRLSKPDIRGTIFTLAQDFLCVYGLDGSIQFFNPAFPRVLGYFHDELLGREFTEFLHPEDRDKNKQMFYHAGQFPNTFENRYLCKNGTVRVIRWTSQVKHQCIFVVGSDITDHRKAEMALRKAKQDQVDIRLHEASLYAFKQTAFISQLCHEIRNPLSGIFGLVESLKAQVKSLQKSIGDSGHIIFPALKATLDEHLMGLGSTLKDVDVCIHYQKSVLDANLDLNKIIDNKIVLDTAPFDLKQLLQEVLTVIQSNALKKELKLNVRAPQAAAWVGGDSGRLKQVFINLIGNAIKFTEHGHIDIRLTMDKQTPIHTTYRFEVADTGIGLTAPEIEKLFERFSQVHIGGRYGGSGLGLYIVKSILTLMGGEISVKSGKGKGTVFSCLIPFQTLSEREYPVLTGPPKVPELKRSRFSPANSAFFPGYRKITLLIVEDNLINQKILKRMLEQKGYSVLLANDGEEAVALYKNPGRKFQMIVTDIRMPRMDGITAVREIRQYEQEKKLLKMPIVALSGNALPEDKEKALAAGMDRYLTKPFQKEEIYQVIDDLLKILPAGSKEEEKTTGVQIAQNPAKIWPGSFQGKIFFFEERPIAGDGDCGFRVLETNRRRVFQVLNTRTGSQESRHFLVPEIRAFLNTEDLNFLEGYLAPTHYQALDKARSIYLSAVNKAEFIFNAKKDEVQQLPLLKKAREEKTIKLEDRESVVKWLCAYLEAEKSSEYDYKKLKTELEACYVQLWEAETQYQRYLESEPVYAAYISAYLVEENGRSVWLGYLAATLYARYNIESPLNLYIWGEGDSPTTPLRCLHHHLSGAAYNTYHLFHTHRYTHYNLLISTVKQAEKAQLENKSPPITDSPLKTLETPVSFNHPFSPTPVGHSSSSFSRLLSAGDEAALSSTSFVVRESKKRKKRMELDLNSSLSPGPKLE